jgi:hypothetical protein
MAAKFFGLSTTNVLEIAEHIGAINELLYEPTSKFTYQVPICEKQLGLDVL